MHLMNSAENRSKVQDSKPKGRNLNSIALALMPPNGGANRHARRERLTPKRDFRQEVTENIIRILEQGTAHGRNRGKRASSKCQITQRRINHAGAAGLQQANITRNLWGFAQLACADNPPPALLKEGLFVDPSRFCAVRYCIARIWAFG
jgi:hypothetical protein